MTPSIKIRPYFACITKIRAKICDGYGDGDVIVEFHISRIFYIHKNQTQTTNYYNHWISAEIAFYVDIFEGHNPAIFPDYVLKFINFCQTAEGKNCNSHGMGNLDDCRCVVQNCLYRDIKKCKHRYWAHGRACGYLFCMCVMAIISTGFGEVSRSYATHIMSSPHTCLVTIPFMFSPISIIFERLLRLNATPIWCTIWVIIAIWYVLMFFVCLS